MRFFITGGSGFLGINLVRYLLKRGHVVTSYDLVAFDYPEKDAIVWHKADIRDYPTLVEAMKGSDVVVHCAAALPLYSPEDIRSTDIMGTDNVVKAAKSNGIKRVIHISSTAVYGIPDHHPLYETDKLDGVGEYGKAKIAAEEICLGYRKEGMIVPILRPKSFVGPERLGVFALFYDWALSGACFPLMGSGKNRYQLLDVEDLCDVIYMCAIKDDTVVNDTFNIGAKVFGTMKEDYQAVLDEAGFGKYVIGIPAYPMLVALRILERLQLSPLYKWVYETAFKDSFVSIEKAEQQLGYTPKFSNKDALIKNFRWYKNNLDSFRGESGISHRVPWKQGVLAYLKPLFSDPYRVLKYLTTGGIGAITNLGITYLCVDVFDFVVLLGSSIGLGVSMVIGFLLQKFWTFSESTLSRLHTQFGMYLSVSFVGLLFNGFLVYFLVSMHVHYLIAQTVSIAAVALLSFFVYRSIIFTFKKRD